jgi:hypothetical protein
MELTPQSNRTARLAAALFFFVCVPLSIWESSYVHSKIFVAQDPATTASNLLSNEFIFRTSIVTHLLGTFIFTLMALLFYRLLRPVDKHLSRLMVVPILAQLPIVFIFEALNFTALMTIKAEVRPTFDVVQQQEVAYLLLRIHRYGFGADKIIFGLYFIPFGMLIFRSGYTPRIIAILMMLGGAGYVVDSCVYILLQRVDYLTLQSLKLYASACYSLALLWILIKGVRDQSNHLQTKTTQANPL